MSHEAASGSDRPAVPSGAAEMDGLDLYTRMSYLRAFEERRHGLPPPCVRSSAS